MFMLIKRILNNRPFRRFSALILIVLFLVFQHSCSNSLDNNKVSDDPINTAIIGISGNPDILYGNASDESVLQVNTELVANGTPINFEITFSDSLPPDLRGCLFDSSQFINNGMAFVNYLAGVLVGIDNTATVNISATINPVDGDRESDFITLTLQGVGMIPPEDQDITVENPMAEDPMNTLVTLIFNTIGIEPGTLAEVSVSNPTLGLLNGAFEVVNVPVLGSVDAGEFVVEYTGFVGQGGTQIITARIFLEVPPELAALCPMPPPEDLVIEVAVVITQTVEEAPQPTMGPTP